MRHETEIDTSWWPSKWTAEGVVVAAAFPAGFGTVTARVVAYLDMLGCRDYSLVLGVNGMCYSNTAVCTTLYHEPAIDHPVATGM